MKHRIEYIEIAKGLLILLVVFGHVWRAIFNNEILQSELVYKRIDNWIYSFHMPAFFFLAGLFALKSASCSSSQFLVKKLRTIAYPYAVWSVLQTGLQILMAGTTTHVVTLTDLFRIPLVPVMQFWFLYALFFVFIVFIGIKKITDSCGIFLLVGLLLTVFLNIGCIPDIPAIIFVCNYFVYFAMGILCSEALLAQGEWIERKGLLTILAGISAVFSLGSVQDFFAISFDTDLLAPILALPGIALILCAAALITNAGRCISSLLSFIGGKSLEIFVAHVLFLAAYRIGLLKIIHVHDFWLHLIGGVTAGLIGPLLLAYIAEKIRFKYLFVWPTHGR